MLFKQLSVSRGEDALGIRPERGDSQLMLYRVKANKVGSSRNDNPREFLTDWKLPHQAKVHQALPRAFFWIAMFKVPTRSFERRLCEAAGFPILNRYCFVAKCGREFLPLGRKAVLFVPDHYLNIAVALVQHLCPDPNARKG